MNEDSCIVVMQVVKGSCIQLVTVKRLETIKNRIMNEQLEKKEVEFSDWLMENHPNASVRILRVLFFDPTEIYKRIDVDVNKRIQYIGINKFFPRVEGICPCGCGEKVNDKRRVWATESCNKFAWSVRNIICNAYQQPHFYIRHYHGSTNCIVCDDPHAITELDHIIPVKHGGGGCWLSNYEYLCKKCHRDKTNKDFGMGKYNNKGINQTRMFD